jgi:ankyrin repeat protein
MVKCIIEEYHMDIYAKDWCGSNVLHYASSNGHLEIVKYLVSECHMDIHIADLYRKNALHYSSKDGHIELVKYLINECNNCNSSNSNIINVQDNYGFAALHYALRFDHIEVVQYLILECQADITLIATYGGNIFEFAYRSKYCTDIVVMLFTRLCPQPIPKNDNN